MELSPDLLDILPLLLNLHDLDELGDVALLDLARDARIEELNRGATLRADQHHDRNLYLIEGEVVLVVDGKTMHTITAGTDRALSPLFRVRTHGLEARCASSVRLLSLDEATFTRYAATIKRDSGSGIGVRECAATDDEAELITEEIRQVFYHREVDLPSMPEVAIRISRAVQNQDADFRSIAATIQTDPVIAARIVQVANSAMYTGVRRVESVQQAITRIGLQAARAIVMSVVLKKLFIPVTPLVCKRMPAYYAHSIRVAAISNVLARHLEGFDPERAFLAGLIHDIGVLPLLILADTRPQLNRDADLLERVLAKLGATIGGMLLEQWEFEAEFVTVARESENWMRDVEAADYCDIVQIAQLHCVMLGGRKVEAPPMNELPAFRRLHLEEIDPVMLIEQSRQEISEIVSLLTS
jgi:HD-like signal output (HDOD) protein